MVLLTRHAAAQGQTAGAATAAKAGSCVQHNQQAFLNLEVWGLAKLTC